MTIVKSNKKRAKGQQSMTSMICYTFLLICLVVGVLLVLFYEEETIQMGNNKKSHHRSNGKHGDDDGDLVYSRTMGYTLKSGLDGILSGDLHLISLSGGIGHSSSKPYAVHGTFCHLDWFRHKDKPSSVPMNKDLIHQSRYCDKTKVSLDLYDVVTKAREYDEKVQQQATPAHDGKSDFVTTMEPKGFVFHESRCGSTLVANSLAAFNPERNRVYSESAPPITAAKMYDPKNKSNSLQLLRDVVYMMGRTNDEKEKDLFFKIQSIGVKSIHIFREAFPQTPWIFVYRNPVQVMRSHLKTKGTSQAVCLRSQHHPQEDLYSLVSRIGNTQPQNLSHEEFCAAHLATLCEAALTQVKDSNGLGKVVNYDNLMSALVENIIPKHFLQVESLPHLAKKNIEDVSEFYSKGRGGGKMWDEDSHKKEETAWQEMKDACSTYLQPSYDELEKVQEQQWL